jgi:4'-phosphopantetheinyl transferase
MCPFSTTFHPYPAATAFEWLRATPHATCAEAPATLAENHSEVHIWRINANESNTAALAGSASEQELAHAKRFRFSKDRDEFITGRGFRRYILSSYLEIPLHAVQFRQGQYGKPELVNRMHGSRLTFSISHSCGMILSAITVDKEVGIDIEFIDSKVDFRRLEPLVFSPSEVMWLSQVSDQERQRNYFQCWTRKEAFLKALGEGLSDRIRQLEIISRDGELVPSMSGISTDHWKIRDLDVGSAFAATVVVAGRNCSFRFWDWSF